MANTGDILCERCGYCLHGVTTLDRCAECGLETALSMPARRLGSPWQQRQSFESFLRTTWAVLRHPVRVWDGMRADARGAEPLRLLYIGIASIGWGAVVCYPMFADFFRAATWRDISGAELMTLMAIPIVFGALIVLSLVLWMTLAAIQRLRAWRASPAVLAAVTAHACVGLLLGPPLAAGALACSVSIDDGASNWLDGLMLGLWIAQLVVPIAHTFTLGVTGLRQMRFANRPRRTTKPAPTSVARLDAAPHAVAQTEPRPSGSGL